MEDLPARLADFLEAAATRVRALSVDRVAQWTKVAALAIPAATLAFIAFLLILIGLFRLIARVTGVTTAYAILGGLFILLGLFLWSRRTRVAREDA